MQITLVLSGVWMAMSQAADHGQASRPVAAETFIFEGQEFPVAVDLSHKFPQKVPQQGRLGSCASFAAIAIVEQACHSVLQKKVGTIDLSEAYAVYRRTLHRVRTHEYSHWRNLDPEKEDSVYAGANGTIILRDILEGNIAREEALPYEDFRDQLATIYKEMVGRPLRPRLALPTTPPVPDSSGLQPMSIKDLPPLTTPPERPPQLSGPNSGASLLFPPPLPMENQSPQEFMPAPQVALKTRQQKIRKADEKLESLLEKKFGSIPTLANGAEDEELAKCFSLLDSPLKINPTGDLSSLTLLSQGVPFACHAYKHVTVFLGYRRSPNSPNGVEYLVRDSHYPKAVWRPGNLPMMETCVQVSALVPKKQMENLKPLIDASVEAENRNESIRTLVAKIRGWYYYGFFPTPGYSPGPHKTLLKTLIDPWLPPPTETFPVPVLYNGFSE